MENKLIYIASPYAGNIEVNVAFAKLACRYAMSQGHTPVAVHLLYPQMLRDSDPAERELGLRLGHRVLRACDELWVCGDLLSAGMKREIQEAKALGVPIRSVPGQELRAAMEPEQLRALKAAFLLSTPLKFEIRDRVYGNTGGGCMVGTVQFYLPDLERSVWVNCNVEGVTITAADYVWNEDGSESWKRYEDVLLYDQDFSQASPEAAGVWLPMIKEALAYTIGQETAACREGHIIELPAAWLPDAYRQRAEPEYLTWLQEQGKDVSIGKGGVIEVDAAFSPHTQDQPGTMEMQ